MNVSFPILLTLVISAQLPPVDPEHISDIVFPHKNHTHILIPADAIKHQRIVEDGK